MAVCATDTTRALSCRNSHAASNLKLISIFVIFFTSVIGISSPVMLARLFHGKSVYDKAILSTSLVYVLPDAFDALADCQVASQHPWKDFPFSDLVTLIGVLAALLVDLTSSSHVDSHGKSSISLSALSAQLSSTSYRRCDLQGLSGVVLLSCNLADKALSVSKVISIKGEAFMPTSLGTSSSAELLWLVTGVSNLQGFDSTSLAHVRAISGFSKPNQKK